MKYTIEVDIITHCPGIWRMFSLIKKALHSAGRKHDTKWKIFSELNSNELIFLSALLLENGYAVPCTR